MFGGGTKLTHEEQRGLGALPRQGWLLPPAIPSNGKQALFTDFTFDNLGIPVNPENPAVLRDPYFIDLGLGGYLASARLSRLGLRGGARGPRRSRRCATSTFAHRRMP